MKDGWEYLIKVFPLNDDLIKVFPVSRQKDLSVFRFSYFPPNCFDISRHIALIFYDIYRYQKWFQNKRNDKIVFIVTELSPFFSLFLKNAVMVSPSKL